MPTQWIVLIFALLILAACATAPEEAREPTTKANTAMVEAYRAIICGRDSTFWLCDFLDDEQ